MFTPSYPKSSHNTLPWQHAGPACVLIMSPIPHSTSAQGTAAELSEQVTHAGNDVPTRFMTEMAQFMAVPGTIREEGGEGSDLN